MLAPLTRVEVQSARYVQLLAALEESNLPPGGLATVRDLALHTHLRPGSKALHAGCNAGYLSREMARRTGCTVLGVDISPDMVAAANARAAEERLSDVVRHERHDLRKTSLPDQEFDVVFSGGALAFVEGHADAVGEMVRVTKPYGLLADAQLYYHQPPPPRLLAEVSRIIEVQVPQYDHAYWLSLYADYPLEQWWRSEAKTSYRSDAEVDQYCRTMVLRCGEGWSDDALEVLEERLREIFHCFNENMKYLSSTTYVYLRRPSGGEPALFT